MRRREFLADLALAGPGLAFASRAAFAAPAQARVPIIDGLGEIRISYPRALLEAILSSGLNAAAVTVGNPALQGYTAWDDTAAEAAAYDAHVAAHPDLLARALNASDVADAASRGVIALIYYTQNATPIGDDIDNVERLRDLGVRIVQLTYNSRNLLGDGCLERTNAGLSSFGIEVVERLQELGMLVDVSHCGEATTLDGIRHARKPVAITHSGCKEVFDHPRAKSDSVLRLLADRGGVIGIFQINPYLGPRERNTLDAYMAHIDHAIRVAGIEHVGIGSDREYRTIPDTAEERQKLAEELSRLRPITAAEVRWPFFLSELNHPRRMETIRSALTRRGHSASDVEKLMGGNFQRLFRDTLG